MNFDDLYEWIGPDVQGPMPLLLLPEGWLDTSEVVARSYQAIVHQSDLTSIAEFDTAQLLDQRARRPTMTVIDGVTQCIDWPTLELALGTDNNDMPFLLLHGPEPDFAWRPFARAVATLTATIGVSMAFTLGAYPAPHPHTRPTVVSATATKAELLVGREHTSGAVSVPVGVFAAISNELAQFGVDCMGFWAQVPYYLSAQCWPKASLALLEELTAAANLQFDLSHIRARFADADTSVDSMLTGSAPLADVVSGLESRYDDLRRLDADLPDADKLEEQLQEYLRTQDDD